MKENTESPVKKFLQLGKQRYFPFIIVAILAVILVLVFLFRSGKPEDKREIITISTLEKIVNVSQLSTFTAVYNGIAEVKEEEETQYYVSYEAKVNAGIDFEKIKFDLDEEASTIHITLPQVSIRDEDVTVDITSLDYIFLNDKKNASSVSQEAYRACEADALAESTSENAIVTLAKQNAENIMKALVEPFLDQLEEPLELDIDWEG